MTPSRTEQGAHSALRGLLWCAGVSAAMMVARKVIGGQNDVKPYGGVRPTGVPATGGSA